MADVDRRDVVVVVCAGVVLLDLAGPVQVLTGAGGYRLRLASLDGHAVLSDTGVVLNVDCALSDVDGPVDTVVVPGPPPSLPDRFPPALIAGIARLGGAARRVASVCTGAFLLAEAGLLAGRQATTHWSMCAELAARFPDVAVRPNAIHVRDGRVVTSAGVTAGIDMALALVEEDRGADVARNIARHLVVFLQRPGGQSQFSAWGDVPAPRTPALRAVLDTVAAEPAADHSLAGMAARAMVSERHLTRLFRRELGITPGQYVTRVRVEAARTLLESSDAGVEVVARRCGWGSDETMRRVFLQVLGTTPTEYRHRFTRLVEEKI
ncbi:transcriptional regulator, AraC family with amidase-like domain [Lentzea xinjiangensis]|uniref:Transcriptional regulator, AraC family with amidase-like domain n=1 Tax=Lentzea xinjiangensis TaxID=402600 RepID=A0A1H9W254_9PSEU|nr:transcriptional regulator, AraC family with amidase-like domain [Lentzea xinjiangensis]